MKFKMSKELKKGLKRQYDERFNGEDVAVGYFEGTIIIKGANLYRGREYGEDFVELHGFISFYGRRVLIYEGKYDPKVSIIERAKKTIIVTFNPYSSFDQLKKAIAMTLAYHEGYEI